MGKKGVKRKHVPVKGKKSKEDERKGVGELTGETEGGSEGVVPVVDGSGKEGGGIRIEESSNVGVKKIGPKVRWSRKAQVVHAVDSTKEKSKKDGAKEKRKEVAATDTSTNKATSELDEDDCAVADDAEDDAGNANAGDATGDATGEREHAIHPFVHKDN